MNKMIISRMSSFLAISLHIKYKIKELIIPQKELFRIILLRQRDNFRFGQSKNFRFLENRVRFFFSIRSKENRHERGFYHVEQKRG